ncbi:hypothetical protein BH23GEM8_BH23GEM8_11730 [soil metagenome]
MCILCDHGTLELLTTPLERLDPGQLGNAIRTARDAASPGVLDHAEAVLREETAPNAGVELYSEIVVARALEAGVLKSSDAFGWDTRLTTERGSLDPRVQAFVSSCAEILDDYRVLFAERRQVLERFLETAGDALVFVWLGQDGELWFEYRGELYAVLAQMEAMEIVERELTETLHTLGAQMLIRYTMLPDTGIEVLENILARPPEAANALLAGMIDLPGLADDRVRVTGYAPYFPGDGERTVEDLRFGEWVIIRHPAS